MNDKLLMIYKEGFHDELHTITVMWYNNPLLQRVYDMGREDVSESMDIKSDEEILIKIKNI